jgi:hypothetical protein
MFDHGMLIVGKLDEILDDGGTTAYPLVYKTLDATTFEVEMSLTKVDRPMLYDHIAWVVPVLSSFEPTRLIALSGSEWMLRKVLLAVNELYTPEAKVVDITSAGLAITRYGGLLNDYPRLKGCAKQIPLDAEEKFLCDIHRIKYG